MSSLLLPLPLPLPSLLLSLLLLLLLPAPTPQCPQSAPKPSNANTLTAQRNGVPLADTLTTILRMVLTELTKSTEADSELSIDGAGDSRPMAIRYFS